MSVCPYTCFFLSPSSTSPHDPSPKKSPKEKITLRKLLDTLQGDKNTFLFPLSLLYCTMVNKGIIIKILDFEFGPFSETSRLIMTWKKRILDYLFREKSFSLAEN